MRGAETVAPPAPAPRRDHTGRMLKKFASGVLASLRDSTYRSVRLASSLDAALLDGLFEHPADYSGTVAQRISIITATCRTKLGFSAGC